MTQAAAVLARLRAHGLALAAVAMLVMAVWQPPMLGAAARQNEAVLASAVAVYAVLRTINAAVSTAKETTVGIGLVGSLQAKPAMVLDPLDDTVRRVADVTFAVAAVSGLLAVGLAPLCTVGAGLAAVGLGGMYVAGLWPGAGRAWVAACRSLAVLGLAFGLVFPVGYGAGGWLGDALTADRLAAATERLRASETALQAETDGLTAPQAAAEAAPRGGSEDGGDGVVDGTLRWLGSGVSAAQDSVGGLVDRAWAVVPARDAIAARGDAILTASLDIMAVYALRLLVFPVLTIVVLVVVLRAVLAGGASGVGVR